MPFAKGNNANPNGAPVKEERLSTWIERELDRPAFDLREAKTMKEYEAAMTKRQRLARKIVDKTLSSDAIGDVLAGANFIANRTEGAPKQEIDHKSDGEKIQSVLFVKPEKMQE